MKIKNISTSNVIITDMISKGQSLIIYPNQEMTLFDEDTEKSSVLKQYITDGVIQKVGEEEPGTGAGELFVYDDTKKFLELAKNFQLAPTERRNEDYSYMFRIDDGVGMMTGGVSQKSYVIGVSVTRPLGSAATLDSNDAIIKGSYSNYAVNDANFIMRGVNVGITNRDTGVVGMMNHLLGCQGKSGTTAGKIVALTLVPENYGTVTDEFGALVLQMKNEGVVAILEYGLKIENLNNSLANKVTSAILVANSGVNTGFVTGLDLNGASLTNEIVMSNGTKVTVSGDDIIFTNAATTKSYTISMV